MKFRKKPVVIEAVQFTGSNQAEVLKFIYPDMSQTALDGAQVMNLPVVLSDEDGDTTILPREWIIKGANGRMFLFHSAEFAAEYEPVID